MATAEYYRQLAWRIATEEFGDTPLRDIYFRMLAQESMQFNPDVVEGRRNSPAGARGIAQLMPAHWGAVDPTNAEAAARYGARYLSQNIRTFNGDIAQGVAAYNAGPGNIQQAVRSGGEAWQRFIPDETKKYLAIVQPTGVVGPQSQRQAAGGQRPPARAFPVQGYQGAVDPHWGENRGGADLFANPGTPVLATSGGQVVSAGWGDIGGWNVTIQGDDGLQYYYAHLDQQPLVQAGQRVTTGARIGGVGDTGNAKGTGAHLHLGIGPSIVRGTGPAGGTGGDFDATTLLQQTLAGGNAMPEETRPAPPRVTVNPELMDLASQLQKEVAARRAERDKAIADRDALPPEERLVFDQVTMPAIEKAYTAALDSWLGVQKEIRLQANAGLSEGDMLALDEQDVANAVAAYDRARARDLDAFEAAGQTWDRINEQRQRAYEADVQAYDRGYGQRTDAYQADVAAHEIATGILSDLLANDRAFSQTVFDVLDGNREDLRQAVGIAISRQQLDLDKGQAVIAATAELQAMEAARAATILKRAEFIDAVTFRNAMRRLPAGQEHVTGFEPSSALNTLLTRMGLPEMVVKAQTVDPEELDALNTLRRAEQGLIEEGYGRPDTAQTMEDIEGLRTLRDTPTPGYAPQPIDVEDLEFPTGDELRGQIGTIPDWRSAAFGPIPAVPNANDEGRYGPRLAPPDYGALVPDRETPDAPADWRTRLRQIQAEQAAQTPAVSRTAEQPQPVTPATLTSVVPGTTQTRPSIGSSALQGPASTAGAAEPADEEMDDIDRFLARLGWAPRRRSGTGTGTTGSLIGSWR